MKFPRSPRRALLLATLASFAAVRPGRANLLRNGGFEEADFGIQNGSGSFPGWFAANYRYSYNYVTTNDVSYAGQRHYVIENGGRIETSADARVAVTPGQVYRLAFAALKKKDDAPGIWNGLTPAIQFFDAAGNLLRTAERLPVQPSGATTAYAVFELVKTAPAGAVSAGVKLELLPGGYPNDDTVTYYLDAVSLDPVPEMADTADLFAAPRVVDANGTATVRVRYTATAPREVLVRLTRGEAALAERRVAVGAGRGIQDVAVPLPADLADATDYAWKVALVAPGQPFGQALGAMRLDGVTADRSPLGNTDIPADNPYLLYSGRWDLTNPAAPVVFWNGSHLACRFEGTSAQARFTNPGTGSDDGVEFLAVVDGNDAGLAKFTVPPGFNGYLPVVSGLPDGVHTLELVRNSEVRVLYPSFGGLRLDAGRGLRRPEPFAGRRVAFFGDSITSGSAPDPKPGVTNPRQDMDDDWTGDMVHSYSIIAARALGADYQITAKGATGVARSFTFNYVAKDYYDKQCFDVFDANDPGNTPYDFTRWPAQFVVFNYGQNDAGRGAPASEYIPAVKDFITRMRAAYPAAPVIVTVGEMGAGLGLRNELLQAVTEYSAANPAASVDLLILNSDGLIGGSHPHRDQHRNMALGSAYHEGLAEFIANKIPAGTIGQNFVPAAPLRNWRTLQNLPANGSGDLANPSRDGVSNLLKYAFNLAPNAGDLARSDAVTLPENNGTAGLPGVFRAGPGMLTVKFVRRKAATDPGVLYLPEQSADLTAWQPLEMPAAMTLVESLGATWERVTITVPTNLPREFFRVRVTPG